MLNDNQRLKVLKQVFNQSPILWNLVKTEWIRGIDIDEKREAKIQSYFSNEIKIHIAKELDELDSLIETLKLRTRGTVDDNDDVFFIWRKQKKWIVLL